MAKIDDSVKKKVPELRFKGFTDEWEQRKLGEVTTLSSSKRIHLSDYVTEGIPFYRGSEISTGGITGNQELFISQEKFDEIKEKYGVPSEGDILVTAVGTLGNLWKVDSRRFYYKDGNLIQISKMQVNSDYLLTYFTGGIGKKRLLDSAAGSNQKALTMVKMREITVDFPSEDEQKKIGAFFKQLDDTIALHQRKLDLLKEQKKGYLQKMFPKNGAKVPELRFAGFADDWEERKLGQYTKLITKGTTPKDKTGIGDVNFVKVENITNGKIYPINKIKQNEHDNYLKRSRLEEKDILFSIAGTLGRTAIVNKSILPANTNQALAIIRGYDFDTNFLITSLAGNVVKEYIRRNPTVGAQPNLSLEQVGNLLVNTPNAEEQQKIGSFFQQLDETIALHQRKLDLLKEQKKGFLQKMFV